MPRRSLSAIAVALALALPSAARAQSSPAEPPADELDVSYLYDGGAVPFIYGSLVVAGLFNLVIPMPDEPRLFSADEGGAIGGGDTIPEVAVVVYGIGVGGAIAVLPTRGRWYHFKGFLEATATTLALTEVAKTTFGRHRPHWEPGSDEDARRSFFSGHSSMTFSTSTYLGLYLHQHVFSRWRAPGQRYALWELVPHLILAGGSAAIAWTRVDDQRHHPSDVITGAAVGTLVSTAFFAWQESRLDERARRTLSLGPGPGEAGLSLRLSF